jgi:hypothetical protein
MNKITREEFAAAHAEGLTDTEICERFKITRQAVHSRRSVLGLSPNKKPVTRVQNTCQKCGTPVYPKSVHCVKCHNEINPASKRSTNIVSESQIVPIFQARAAGETIKQIALRFHVKPITVYQILGRRIWKYVPVPADLLAAARSVRSPRTKSEPKAQNVA